MHPVNEYFRVNARIANCLANEGITTLEQLAAYTWAELRRLPNMGDVSVQEIEFVLNHEGMALKGRALPTAKSPGYNVEVLPGEGPAVMTFIRNLGPHRNLKTTWLVDEQRLCIVEWFE
jgi:hypothetical protein